MRRVGGVGRGDAGGPAGAAAAVRAPGHAARGGGRAGRGDGPADPVAEGPRRRGTAAAAAAAAAADDRLEFPAHPALLDLQRQQPPDGPGLLLPLALPAVVRGLDRAERVAGRAAPGADERRPGRGPVHLRLPVGRGEGVAERADGGVGVGRGGGDVRRVGCGALAGAAGLLRVAVRLLWRRVHGHVGEDGDGGERGTSRVAGYV